MLEDTSELKIFEIDNTYTIKVDQIKEVFRVDGSSCYSLDPNPIINLIDRSGKIIGEITSLYLDSDKNLKGDIKINGLLLKKYDKQIINLNT